MVTLPIRYPLDPTGVSPDNKVVGEIHTLPNRTVRAVAPGYGSFFAESIVIRDSATGLTLTKGTQYICTEMLEFPTGRYGKEIDGIILIKDTTVSSQIEIDYQTLGGEYSTNSDAIIQMLNSAELDNRPVAWGDIIGKPDVFTPAKHYHDVGDIYGFEYVVHAIERVREAILIGDDASHDQIYRYIDASFNQLNTQLTATQSSLSAHLADTNNPHQTTKVQIGLALVDNFATATVPQGQAGTATNLFMTPAATAAAITQQAGSLLTTHINDYTNPHQTTKVQVGLGNVDNFLTATQAQAQTGTDNSTFMTPLRVAQAITQQAGALLTNHINDHTNPHATTAAQVGLGNVSNFATAAQADAEAGTSNTLFMTPLRVAQAIAALVGNSFNAHIQNFSNPHQVTKAQVGLGSVNNFGLATTAQAQAGTDNATYMTPLLTAQAITSQVGNNFNSHISNFSNPHQVTKAQIGLGSVDNFLTATDSEAQAATLSNRFMTPRGVALAINNLGASLVNAHASRTDNPHQTTAAQVGLGNVQNYGIATDGQAADSSQTSVYTTPHSVFVALGSYAPSKTGAGASGTWGINITGNAATATTASTANSVAWTNVSGRPTAVSSFTNDAGYITSTGSYNWTNVQTFNGPNSAVGVAGNSGTIFESTGSSASISFLRPGAYGINFGLDSDNVIRLGGWSNGTNVYRMQLDTSGNATFSGTVTAVRAYAPNSPVVGNELTNKTYVDSVVGNGVKLTDFTGSGKQSLAGSTGYQVLPGGLIIQWTTATVSGPSSTTVNWPIAFPSICFGVVVSPNGSFQSTGAVNVVAHSATQCTVDCVSGSDTPAVFIIGIGK